MDNIDEFFRESHYNIIRVLLGISGVWPFHSVVKRCIIYLGFLLVVGSGLTFQVMGMIEVWEDSFEVFECVTLLIYAMDNLMKAVCMICSIRKLKTLLIKMKEYWYSPKSDEETRILQSYAIYGKKFGYAYTVIMFGYSAFFLFLTLLSKLLATQPNEDSDTSDKIQDAQKGIPYRVNYMIDLNTYYIPIFLHTVTCDVSYTLLLVSSDVLYLTLVQYCCGLLATLRYLLEDTLAFKDNDDDTTQAIPHQSRCYTNVVYSIRRHTEAIQFINIMESLFRLPLFIHMGCVIAVLSSVGFQIITSSGDMTIFMRYSIYLCAAVMNAFFGNWQGQKIIDHSEKVYDYAYNTQWYDMPNSTKKLIILIMLRSMKPLQITAGKFFVMSYVNFNAIMRVSSSYFMLLRSMQ